MQTVKLLRERLPSGASGRLTGVADVYGKAYRRLRVKAGVGDIVRTTVHHTGEDRAVDEAPAAFRILSAPIHKNTIHALLRAGGVKKRNLAPGTWYEVLCD